MKSSSCITTIIEVKSDEEILDVIDMVNDFKADRKHLTFIVQRLNQSKLKNITISYGWADIAKSCTVKSGP